MRILCTSDWHVHSFSDFSHPVTVVWDEDSHRFSQVESDGSEVLSGHIDMGSRLFYILDGISQMLQYALDNNIHYVLFAGDLFHHRGTIEVLAFNCVRRILESYHQASLEFYILSGNHDQIDSSLTPVTSVSSFSDIATVIETPQLLDIDGIQVAAVPYSANRDFILSSINVLYKACNDTSQSILMAHLGVTGAVVGSGSSVMRDEYSLDDLMADKWKYVILGHYHRPQTLSRNTFYCGTPVQNTFNDEVPGKDGYNGFFVVDTDRRYDIRFVPVIEPRFITVSSPEELTVMSSRQLTYNHIRVRVTADRSAELSQVIESTLVDDTADLRVEVERDYSEHKRSSVGVTQSPSEAVTTYANENWEDTDTIHESLSVGMSILSQITDCE